VLILVTKKNFLCTSDDNCTLLTKTNCYTCIPICDTATACSVDPCTADVTGAACAAKVSTAATCVSDYCGGCLSHWYVGTAPICTKSGSTCIECPVFACPNGTVHPVAIDPQTGCDTCNTSCISVCPDIACANVCPYGDAVDSNGCKTCNCLPCPPEAVCDIVCVNGYVVDPTTSCKTCQCAPSICPQYLCDLNCTLAVNSTTGCTLCQCKICPDVVCLVNNCTNGVYHDSNGCPTCNCLPPCVNQCPNGYDFSTTASGSTNSGATTSTNAAVSTVCKCLCPPVSCLVDCADGYVIDAYGCQTCQCVPVYTNCTKLPCAVACPLGYAADATGCPTCQCIPPPTICPDIECTIDCVYGQMADPTTNCPSCNCNPCPAVLCTRYCEYGFATAATSGCPTCTCNTAPACPPVLATASGVALNSTAIVCPLACQYGTASTNGCPTCTCLSAPPCTCKAVPTTSPVLCPDGVTYQKTTNVCATSADNVCSWVVTECPIGISLTLSTGVTLTTSTITAIEANIGITNSADVTITQTTNSDGTTTYKIWVQKEGLPSNTTSSQVNNAVSTQAKQSDPNAQSYIISSTPNPSSFAMIIVPYFFLGLW